MFVQFVFAVLGSGDCLGYGVSGVHCALCRPVDTGGQGGQCPPNNSPNLLLETL